MIKAEQHVFAMFRKKKHHTRAYICYICIKFTENIQGKQTKRVVIDMFPAVEAQHGVHIWRQLLSQMRSKHDNFFCTA